MLLSEVALVVLEPLKKRSLNEQAQFRTGQCHGLKYYALQRLPDELTESSLGKASESQLIHSFFTVFFISIIRQKL